MDSLLIFTSVIVVACYGSVVTTVYMTKVNSKVTALWHSFTAFEARFTVPASLNLNIMRSLESLSFKGAQEEYETFSLLLDSLPKTLRNDVLFHLRLPVLMNKTFFKDAFWISQQAVRHICINAIQEQVFLEAEIVFAHDDKCHGMIFVTEGQLTYVYDSTPQSGHTGSPSRNLSPDQQKRFAAAPKSKTDKLGQQAVAAQLREGSSISEPVLWTEWNHCWRLLAAEESTALIVSPDQFADQICEHKHSKIHAVKYARSYVRQLNSSTDYVDDMVSGDDLFDIEALDRCESTTDIHAHYMFLSHYKVEAGTEATLMRDEYTAYLNKDDSHPANDFRSPIFVDSEDLTDLRELRQHVEKTVVFVLLLTPGVLSRPWCLVEIVTAVQNNLTIVPVNIQRPGSNYNYPDEQWYSDLLQGKFLPQASVDLLLAEGITLEDVAKAIHSVFLNIALCFSPHKTKTVRNAELMDILKRCPGLTPADQ